MSFLYRLLRLQEFTKHLNAVLHGVVAKVVTGFVHSSLTITASVATEFGNISVLNESIAEVKERLHPINAILDERVH